jgi:hypothetical protein
MRQSGRVGLSEGIRAERQAECGDGNSRKQFRDNSRKQFRDVSPRRCKK